jgi:hypothetical protein
VHHTFLDLDHVQRCAVGDQPELFALTWYPDDNYNPYTGLPEALVSLSTKKTVQNIVETAPVKKTPKKKATKKVSVRKTPKKKTAKKESKKITPAAKKKSAKPRKEGVSKKKAKIIPVKKKKPAGLKKKKAVKKTGKKS